VSIFFIALVLLGSEAVHPQLEGVELCVEEYYSRGLYNKETGEAVTKTSDRLYYRQVRKVCNDKVLLFLEGLRVPPIISDGDIELSISEDTSNGFKSYYREKVRCSMNPQVCKDEGESQNFWVMLGVNSIVVLMSVKFGFALYKSNFEKPASKLASIAVALAGAIATPGSLYLALISVTLYKDLSTFFLTFWWISVCLVPYIVGTRISVYAGLSKKSDWN